MADGRLDSRRCVWLASLVFGIYGATLSGLTCSNDGSHYALLRAMVDRHTVEISSFAGFTEGNDLAKKDGYLYTDRPPGTALMTLPFYALGQLLPAPSVPLPSRHDADNPALLVMLLAPVTFSALTAMLLYRLLRRWEVSSDGAFLTALSLAFGTVQWKYGTTLFSHAPAGFLLLAAMTQLLAFSRPSVLEANRAGPSPVPGNLPPWTRALSLGLSLGMLVLVEYATLPLVVLLPLCLFWQKSRGTETVGEDAVVISRLWRQSWLALAAGLALPLGFLAWYNTAHFGAPWVTSYAFNVSYPWATSFWTTFDGPLLSGLQSLLLFSQGQVMTTLHLDQPVVGVANQGLLLLSPVFLWAFVGWHDGVQATRERPGIRQELLLVLGVGLLYLLLFSTHHTAHGGMRDGRYLTPFLPLLLAPLGFFLDRRVFKRGVLPQQTAEPVAEPEPTSGPHVGWMLLFFLLFFLSVRAMALHIAFSYNYEYDLTRIRAMAADPRDILGFLRSLFPNLLNLPYLLGVVGVVGVLGEVLRRRLRRAMPET